MVDRNQYRGDGSTGGDEAREEASKEFAEPATQQLPEERRRKFSVTGFSRMRTEWRGEDALMLGRVMRAVNEAFDGMFADADRIMFEIYSVVREPLLDDAGHPRTDEHHLPMWRVTPTGRPAEDWTKLNSRERERFLFLITTRLYAWEQQAADSWGEAMYAKAIWEDRFAMGYESLDGNKTIEARTNRARLESREERYFALFLSHLSRKADAAVRTMNLLAQRLKDVHTAG